MTAAKKDERYVNLLLGPLDKCTDYQPRFGSDKSKGVSLDQFKTLYGGDPFYHWIGLDSELMYAAHRAAGGMTSIYRQIGTGCEQLLRAIIQDALDLSAQQVAWSYEIQRKDNTRQTLTLDARVDCDHIKDSVAKARVAAWLERAGKVLNLKAPRIAQLRGAVFEARQGYKSADAKRANADKRFGLHAWNENYLPVFAIVSTQASASVLRSYRNSQMLVLTGTLDADDTASTFAFFRNVLGFELDEFFKRYTTTMRERCQRVLEALLTVQPSVKAAISPAVPRKKKRP